MRIIIYYWIRFLNFNLILFFFFNHKNYRTCLSFIKIANFRFISIRFTNTEFLTRCRAVVTLYNEYRLARTRRRRFVIAQERQKKREGERKERKRKRYSADIPENGETKMEHIQADRCAGEEGMREVRWKVRRGRERKRSRSTFALDRSVSSTWRGEHARFAAARPTGYTQPCLNCTYARVTRAREANTNTRAGTVTSGLYVHRDATRCIHYCEEARRGGICIHDKNSLRKFSQCFYYIFLICFLKRKDIKYKSSLYIVSLQLII